jgi:hypothetical protein
VTSQTAWGEWQEPEAGLGRVLFTSTPFQKVDMEEVSPFNWRSLVICWTFFTWIELGDPYEVSLIIEQLRANRREPFWHVLRLDVSDSARESANAPVRPGDPLWYF